MSMIARRTWALRISIVLNVCVLLYVFSHLGTLGPWVDDGSNNWGEGQVGSASQELIGDVQVNSSQRTTGASSLNIETKVSNFKRQTNEKVIETTKNTETQEPNKAGIHGKLLIEIGQESIPLVQPSVSKTLKEAIKCNDKSAEPKRAQRGDYWVLYNYVPMNISVHCWETVTYTTHADYTFLDNLQPLLERWKAPISIAMHAPGTDFQPTVDSIKYLRSCASPLITQFVTFHIYFSTKHVPKVVQSNAEIIASKPYNCSLGAPWENTNLTSKMYKTEKKLLYPVNIGRNIARESVQTHYVLPSDIELYPNPGLPEKFLDMIRRNDQPQLQKSNPKVFVLPIFEVDKKSQPPQNKTHLVQMLKNGTAILFHKKLCSFCHNVPKGKEWQAEPETHDLHVFHVGKRTGAFAHWEPIYIGTNNEPMYEERLSWEGKSDKMTQGYALCVLDYDFLILDNAFLVHRPGIKAFKKDPYRQIVTEKTNKLLKKVIMPELKIMYGTRNGCTL